MHRQHQSKLPVVPKSNVVSNPSTNNAAATTRQIGLAVADPTPVPTGSTATIDEDSDSDVWGDEDDDQFCIHASQSQGNQEPDIRTPSVRGAIPPCHSDETTTTPLERMNLTRQMLASREPTPVGQSVISNFEQLGGSDDRKKLFEKIEVLERQVETYKHESYKYKGEADTMRRKNEDLLEERQENLKFRLKVNEDAKKESQELQKLRSTVETLQREVKAADITAKFASQSSNISRRNVTSANTSIIGDERRPGSNSPNATLGSQQGFSQHSPTVSFPVSSKKASPVKVTPSVEIQPDDEDITVNEVNEGLASASACTKPEQEDDLMDGWMGTNVQARERIFATIDEIIELRFQMILPTLQTSSQEASKEIMRRLVRNCEITSPFPDVEDIMFQWGIDMARKKHAEDQSNEAPPILPSKFKEGTQFHEIRNGIAASFKYGGLLEALIEVRDWLEKTLTSLDGTSKFRLYERNTLTNFWRLLLWAHELWRTVMFEEEKENATIKTEHWVRELQRWSGLIVKCDWRDFFDLNLEKEVRKLSLGILESIMMAGYFEKNHKRYGTLYLILKDTLMKDAFRTVENVRHVIKIVNWSLPDLMIFEYLCFKNKEKNPCLAHVIGENIVKVWEETKDSMRVAQLYVDFAYFLEALMRENLLEYHRSKLACDSVNDLQQIKHVDLNTTQNSERMFMESESIFSQFACPVKYGIPKVGEKMDVDEEVEKTFDRDFSCWVDPANYEDPFGKKKTCQCRKVLMGAAITGLRMVFDGWRKRYYDHLLEIDEDERSEEMKLLALEHLYSSPSTHNGPPSSTEEESSKEKQEQIDLMKCLQEKRMYKKGLRQRAALVLNEILPHKEWSWLDVIRHKRRILATNEALPDYILELGRQKDLFDVGLSKGLIIMNYLQSRSDNLAAAIGSDAYKIYMQLTSLLRLHMDQIDFNKVDRGILKMITPECDEDHLGSASISFACEDNPRLFVPESAGDKFPCHPLPCTPMENPTADGVEWKELAKAGALELKAVLEDWTEESEAELQELSDTLYAYEWKC